MTVEQVLAEEDLVTIGDVTMEIGRRMTELMSPISN